MTGGWQGSDRVKRLPPGWKKIRARVLARDVTCQICGVRPSTHCDHIQAKTDDHRPEGLQGVCAECHGRKSSAEGNAAPRTKPGRTRPPETHPGLR
ncbi:HNH endonuclease [Streptomyces rimosus]|uniref:HNH endonuclease signature motif containing protein n=1 Tax=Streptomyces rimosus TaxID=1927 RepID=UPI0004C633FC|nr:HNH endonuclease [Streptomyces rimosus]